MRFGFLLTVMFTLIAIPLLSRADEAALQVTGAYAYPPMGAGKVAVAFMSIHNPSDKKMAVIGVSSPQFGRVEMHTHSHENGMMQMRQIEQIELPAAETVVLKSGGLHLMLFEPTGDINVGDTIKIELGIDPNRAEDTAMLLPVELPVKARQ